MRTFLNPLVPVRTFSSALVTSAVYNCVVAKIGEWRSLVARFVRDEEVPGSNPGSPTISTLNRKHKNSPVVKATGLFPDVVSRTQSALAPIASATSSPNFD